MKITSVKLSKLVKPKRVHNPAEIDMIMEKAYEADTRDEGLEIREEDNDKRIRLYWRLYSFIYQRHLPFKLKSKDCVMKLYRIREDNATKKVSNTGSYTNA